MICECRGSSKTLYVLISEVVRDFEKSEVIAPYSGSTLKPSVLMKNSFQLKKFQKVVRFKVAIFCFVLYSAGESKFNKKWYKNVKKAGSRK